MKTTIKYILMLYKGFFVWTWNVICIYFGNLPNVLSTKDTYWDCRQTFFNSKEDREIYRREQELLVQKLKLGLIK